MNRFDALVAERVMGNEWRLSISPNTYGPDGSRDGGVDVSDIPHFSSDIAAAWEVVEKMRAREWHFVMEANTYPEVVVKTYRAFGEPHYSTNGINSAPLAICLATLRACGVTEAEIQEAMR